MDKLVVKKKKAHRIAIRCFAALGGPLLLLLLWLTRDLGISLAVLAVSFAPAALLLFHYESWALVFNAEGIRRRCWGGQRYYSWSRIREVTSHHSATEGPCICIRFLDGTCFRFRLEDENGTEAVGVILRHTSIRKSF